MPSHVLLRVAALCAQEAEGNDISSELKFAALHDCETKWRTCGNKGSAHSHMCVAPAARHLQRERARERERERESRAALAHHCAPGAASAPSVLTCGGTHHCRVDNFGIPTDGS